MALSRRVLTRYVAQQLSGGTNNTAIIKSLAGYIVEHHLQKDVRLIVRDVLANLADHGYAQATVTSARALVPELRKEVEAFVRELENASRVELHEIVDSSLLGGIIIETAEKRFDASVATKLKRLRNA